MRICLNMIVKNETAILTRCLEAIRPHISCYVILDTGSTDGTQKFISDYFAEHHLPGEIHEGDFINFGYARNNALSLARQSKIEFDYILFCDADMELVVEDPKALGSLTETVYLIEQRASIDYWNVRLIKKSDNGRYVGVTHEYYSSSHESVRLKGVHYIDHACGSNRTDKFLRDARLLLEDLKTDPQNVRSWFYLAQSWRDAGELEKALECYLQRARMGGWEEERWYAMLEAGRLMIRCKHSPESIEAHLKQTFEARPHRIEPLVDLASFFQNLKPPRHATAYLYAKAGIGISQCDDSLFVDRSSYQWRAAELTAISAFYIGRHDESADLFYDLIMHRVVPAADINRMTDNLSYALAARKGVDHLVDKNRAVTVVLTACSRPELLRKTLTSFLYFNKYPIEEIIVIDDSPDDDSTQKARAICDIFKRVVNIVFIDNPENIGQIRSIDKAYALVKTPYIFHLEDDWEFHESGFIEYSMHILENFSWIFTIWLRAYDDTNGHPIEPCEHFPFNLMSLGYRQGWHGFTFNPGLRRLADYQKIQSFASQASSEWAASDVYMRMGFRAGIHKGHSGWVRHLGWGRSTGDIPNTNKG